MQGMGLRGWHGLPTVIFGSGGISREVRMMLDDIAASSSMPVYEFLGYIENDSTAVGRAIGSDAVVACDCSFADYASRFPVLGVVVPIGTPLLKRRIVTYVLGLGLSNLVFPNLIHPGARFPTGRVVAGVGNIVTAGSTFTCQVAIGNFNLFNLNTTIGHDAVIGDCCVINPLASVSGGVTIGDEVLVGTGANIKEELSIGSGSIVGAGAVVTKPIPSGVKAVGVPARWTQ